MPSSYLTRPRRTQAEAIADRRCRRCQEIVGEGEPDGCRDPDCPMRGWYELRRAMQRKIIRGGLSWRGA